MHQMDVDLVGGKQPDPFGPDIFVRGDPAGNGSGNSRNGSCGKEVTTMAGPVPTSCPAVLADQAEPHGPDPFPDGRMWRDRGPSRKVTPGWVMTWHLPPGTLAAG
jgi:hypothetical protein